MLVVVGGDEILKDNLEDYASKLKKLRKKSQDITFTGQTNFFQNCKEIYINKRGIYCPTHDLLLIFRRMYDKLLQVIGNSTNSPRLNLGMMVQEESEKMCEVYLSMSLEWGIILLLQMMVILEAAMNTKIIGVIFYMDDSII